MSVEKFIKDLEYYHISIIRREYSLDIHSYNLNENELEQLEEYLLGKIKERNYSSLEIARQRLFPKIKQYLEDTILLEESFSWLYVFHRTLYSYDHNDERFLEFLKTIMEQGEGEIIEFHAHEIAHVLKDIGLNFLKTAAEKLNNKRILRVVDEISKST